MAFLSRIITNPIQFKVVLHIIKLNQVICTRKQKMKSSTKSRKNFPNSAFHTNVQTTKRDESPSKEELRKIVLSNLYSPGHENNFNGDKAFFSSINASTKLSKKNSVKALHIVSPSKRVVNEKNMLIQPQTSQSISQEKFFKRPLFKLDLSKRTPSNR